MAFNIESLLETKPTNQHEEAYEEDVEEEEERDKEREEDEDEEKGLIDGWSNLASSQLAILLETKPNQHEEAYEEDVEEEEERDKEREEDEDEEKGLIGGWANLASSQLAIANDLRTPTLIELQMLLGVSVGTDPIIRKPSIKRLIHLGPKKRARKVSTTNS
ncbi:unnamed protein product [Caenorhabditis nigoni]